MNLTQALGKLYENLTGQKPKNTQTKIIMDIAEGIEDGSISPGGGGLECATVKITNTKGSQATMQALIDKDGVLTHEPITFNAGETKTLVAAYDVTGKRPVFDAYFNPNKFTMNFITQVQTTDFQEVDDNWVNKRIYATVDTNEIVIELK